MDGRAVHSDAGAPGRRGGRAAPSPRPYQPLFLRFYDPEMERAFQHDHFRVGKGYGRLGLLILALSYASFGILDTVLAPHVATTSWLVRLGVVCPLVLAALVLSEFIDSLVFLRVAVAVAGAAAAAGIVVIAVQAGPPLSAFSYGSIGMLGFFFAMFFRAAFWMALITTLTLFVGYGLCVLLLMHLEHNVLINNAFYLATIHLSSLTFSHYLGTLGREEFLARRRQEERGEQLNAALLEAEEARRAAEDASRRDPLTHLYNRRHFFEVATTALQESRVAETAFALLMLDIDHFKRINDRFGHLVGDNVLQTVAEILQENLRPGDVACRYGGEEFLIMLPDTGLQESRRLAEHLRRAMERLVITSGGSSAAVTVSAGLAEDTAPRTGAIDELVERADQALYRAKAGGRNRVATAA